MKKLFFFVLISLFLSSCAMVYTPVSGFVYTNVKGPFAVTSNSGSSKVGYAEMNSILGWFASGDASISAAAKSAGISKIHHVDYEASSLLGIVAKYKVYVYGE
jgi:hypothetical protein